jgi:hypothetical protein
MNKTRAVVVALALTLFASAAQAAEKPVAPKTSEQTSGVITKPQFPLTRTQVCALIAWADAEKETLGQATLSADPFPNDNDDSLIQKGTLSSDGAWERTFCAQPPTLEEVGESPL